MSHKRSFGYMDTNELYVKRAFDEYRLNSLKEGAVAPLKKYGFDGLDECLFVVSNSCWPGKRRKKEAYYENQIALTEDELSRRPTTSADERYGRMLSVAINPATFNVLNETRSKLRLERIADMRGSGESLYPSEYARRIKESLSSRVTDETTGATTLFGKAREAVQNNFMLTCGAVFLLMAPYSAKNWIDLKKEYNKVAAVYMNSHEVGINALPLKRDIPEQLTYAVINLTHTNEVTIDLGDDGELTIPEKLSDPQAARVNIRNMSKTLEDNISYTVISGYKTVSEPDKKKIIEHGSKADKMFDNSDASLTYAIDREISYPAEGAILALGNNEVQKAVDIMESYMPADVVNDENSAHTQMTLWKWLTIITGGLGALLTGNGVRHMRRRSVYGRYY